MVLALFGGGMLKAVEALLWTLTLGQENIRLDLIPPLGSRVFVVYAVGIALALAALLWPVAAGIAMLPLGVFAFLFGGPIAKVYGIGIVCAGVALLATGPRRS